MTYLSPVVRARLDAERARFVAERMQLTELVAAARAESTNLTENVGYQAALEELGRVEGRIEQLDAFIASASTTAPDGSMIASGVRCVLDWGGSHETFRYGTVVDGNGDVISPDSPLGQALAGKVVGDQVTFRTPTGRVDTVTVVAIDVDDDA